MPRTRFSQGDEVTTSNSAPLLSTDSVESEHESGFGSSSNSEDPDDQDDLEKKATEHHDGKIMRRVTWMPGDFGKADAEEFSFSAPISNTKQAVIWVKKASGGSVQWVQNCREDQFRWWNFSNRLKPLWFVAKYGLLLLSVFEEPAACQGTAEQCLTMNNRWYSMPFTVLPLQTSAILSFGFYAILALRMRLRKWSLGVAYTFHPWAKFNAAVLALGLICSAAYFISPHIYAVSFICRPLIFIGATKTMRETVTTVFRAAPAYLDVIFSLYVLIFVSTCAGMVLFVKTPEGEADFSNWGNAYAQMMVLFFTSNDPNAWIPALNTSKLSFVFFGGYLVLTLYLLLSLLLARVYNGYKSVHIADIEVFKENQKTSILTAFEYLSDTGDSQGHIQPSSWRAFFVEYCNPEFGGIQVEDTEDIRYNTWRGDLIVSVFHGVNLEAGEGISLKQFQTIMKVFLDRETYIPARRPPLNSVSVFWQTLQDAYIKGVQIGGMTLYWDRIMDVVIFFVFVLTCLEGFSFARGQHLRNIPMFWVLLPITFVYGLEVTAKICILGFERFWNKKTLQHRFDFINIYSLLLVEILYLSCTFFQTTAMARAIILLSAARLFRLCVYMEPLKHVFLMLTRLIPSYWKMGMLLLIVYFIFAAVGRWMFGGMIYNTNPALWHKCGSLAIGANSCGPGYIPTGSYGPGASPFGSRQYDQDQFFSLNFNDTISGFLTLFALMIVNNWYIVVSGFMLAHGSVWVAPYFIAFFIVCNLIVLNILMALVIDVTAAFGEEEERSSSRRESQLMNQATGLVREKPEYMLRRVLDKEEELFADYAGVRAPSRTRSVDLPSRLDDMQDATGTKSMPVKQPSRRVDSP